MTQYCYSPDWYARESAWVRIWMLISGEIPTAWICLGENMNVDFRWDSHGENLPGWEYERWFQVRFPRRESAWVRIWMLISGEIPMAWICLGENMNVDFRWDSHGVNLPAWEYKCWFQVRFPRRCHLCMNTSGTRSRASGYRGYRRSLSMYTDQKRSSMRSLCPLLTQCVPHGYCDYRSGSKGLYFLWEKPELLKLRPHQTSSENSTGNLT